MNIKNSLLIGALSATLAATSWAKDDKNEDSRSVPSIKIMAVYQLQDEARAAFDFFSAEYTHDCGDKPSNRYRSYSRNDAVAARKFQLAMEALDKDYFVTVEPLGCEGNAMKIGHIGVRKGRSF